MFQLERYIPEKYLHEFFDIGLIVKGVYSVFEFLAGLVLLLPKSANIGMWVIRIAEKELAEDRTSAIAQLILNSAQNLENLSLRFIAFYLTIHALIKIILIAALLKKVLWMYPVSIAVFVGFGIYQMERYFHTGSQLLVWLTVLDAIIIWLTWHEYRYYRSRFKSRAI